MSTSKIPSSFIFDQFLGYKSKWEGTPEEFLELMILMDSLNKPRPLNFNVLIHSPTLDKVAEVIMKELKVNFKPYLDFQDLKKRAVLNGQFYKEILDLLTVLMADQETEETLGKSNIEISMESTIEKKSREFEAQAFVARIGKHVKFREE